MKKRILGIFTALALCLVLLPATALAATNVTYLDASGRTQTCTDATDVTSSNTTWNAGWYVAQGTVEIGSRVTVSGEVHLILADGCALTITGGIEVASSKSLTIYGQMNGTGTLTANGADRAAGIGGSDGQTGGTITINGGNVNATGDSYAAGIGGGQDGPSGGTITINGGKVIAKGSIGGSGIGGGNQGSGGAITINGGTVTATGGNYSAGIGGGGSGDGGTITINGGTVIATGAEGGAGIGGGRAGVGGTITITGGDITATGNDEGAGIGGGQIYSGSPSANSGGTINISGGTVKATSSGSLGAGIGGGGGAYNDNGGDGGTIEINGGTVTATGTSYGAGIGGGGGYDGSNSISGGNGGTITISGGTVTATGGIASIGGGGTRWSSGSNGSHGTFTTTNNGTAIIKVGSIGDQTNKANWSGIIFEGSSGSVYGNQTLTADMTIDTGKTLTVPADTVLAVPAGVNLVNNGTLNSTGDTYVDGTLNGTLSGNVYYRLFLTNCKPSGGTITYSGNPYGKANTKVSLSPEFTNPDNQLVRSWDADPQVGNYSTYYEISSMPANVVTVTAIIENALTINTQPTGDTITYGGTTNLSVNVSRNSYISTSTPLSYQWYKDGVEISDATSDSYITPNDLAAGAYTYKCKITCGKYSVTSSTATVTVNKATGSVTITGDPGKTYDGQPAALAGDDYTVTGDGTVTVEYKKSSEADSTYTTTAPTNAGDYTVRVTMAAGTNYTKASATKDFTISRKPVTVSGITAKDKTYDGKTIATLNYENVQFENKVDGDDLTVTATGAFRDQNVGEDKTVTIDDLTLGGTSVDNYILATNGQQTETTASIARKFITPAIEVTGTYTYTGSAITPTFTVKDGETPLTEGDYTAVVSDNIAAGTGKIKVTAKDTGNYSFDEAQQTFTISPAALSASVTLEDWIYGDEPKTPVVNGNSGNGEVTYLYKVRCADDETYSATVSTEAGNYTVKATIAATANYKGAVVYDDFTIKPKVLTVTGLTATDRDYDADNTTVELTGGELSGIVGNDDVSATMPTSGTMDDANAGENKSVDFGTITLTGTKAPNYTLTQPTVTVTIAKADPDVGTVTKTSPDTIYSSTALNSITLDKTGATDGTLKLTDGQTLTAGTANYGWTFTPTDSTNYNAASGTISLTVKNDTLSGISIGSTEPLKLNYKYGEAFQTNGLTVTATYASGTTRNVTAEVTFGALAVGDTSIELSYQGKTCTVNGLTVNKADAPVLDDISIRQKYTVSTQQSKEIGRAGMPANAGTLTYTKGTPSMSDPVSITDWDVDSTGKVTYTLSSEFPNCRATLPVIISSANYEDATVNIHITLTEKDVPTVNANDITVTYTGFAVPASAITGTASVAGTWSFKAEAPVKVADSSENVTVVFTPTDTDNYETVEDIIKVTINKATPTGTPAYTAISTSGKTLADAALTVGSITPVGGSIAWDAAADTAVTANTAYRWTYIPIDTANYNNLTGSITPYVVSYSGGSSSGTTTTTEKKPDGSTTTTTTDKTTGTVTETTKNTDGSTTVVETKKDGTVTETNKTADGTTGTVVTDKNGTVTEVKSSVSSTAAKEAAKSGEAVTLPVEVPAAKNTEDAPAVDVTVPQSAGPVKVEIPVETVTPGTVAVIVNADGTEEIVKATTRGENGVVVPLDGSATVKIVDNSKTFDDVAATDWESDAVAFVSAREIFNGTGDATFDPDVDMTRGMMVTVLARYAGANTEGGETWYDKGLEWAKENGVSDGSNPTGKLTREQMAVMLYRYAGSPDIGGQELNFPDAGNVSDFAANAMRWAVESGLINGMDGNLNPQGYATRAQLAAILMRFCQNVAQ